MNSYKIDSHKLMYHVPRVNDWLQGKNVYPIYMEISPSGACNHRCSYCALDFMEYKNIFLDTEKLKATLSELGELGLKSIMFAGEGEPLLHKNIASIIQHCKDVEIDSALTTNGVLLKPETSKEVLKNLTWIKVSLNAGTKESYSKIHGTKEADFEKVLDNLQEAVEIRKKHNIDSTLGAQLVLLPENFKEVETLAGITKEIGLDYLVIKPYSQHLLSKTEKYKNISYDKSFELAKKLKEYNSESFKAIFRFNAMESWNKKDKSYSHCYALPFWSYIDSSGNVWACSCYLSDNRFNLGSIYEQSFQKIWNSEKHLEVLKYVETELNVSKCRTNCRMNEINCYLHELKKPAKHVNFI